MEVVGLGHHQFHWAALRTHWLGWCLGGPPHFAERSTLRPLRFLMGHSPSWPSKEVRTTSLFWFLLSLYVFSFFIIWKGLDLKFFWI
jgi:hypothetical protein